MKILIALLFGYGIATFTIAQEKGEKVKQKAAETVEATKEYASEKKSQFQERMKKDLVLFDAEIEKLKAKSRDAVGQAKVEVDEQLSKVEAQRLEVSQKMNELSRSTGDAWKDVKKGVESAYLEMKNAFKRASSHFKK